jgi:hypothetical protein
VRLKRTLNRRVGGKEYYKWLVADVPSDTIEALGWKEGQELEGTIDEGRLLLHAPRTKRKSGR